MRRSATAVPNFVTRRIFQQLVVHYNKMMFTLEPNEMTKKLPGKQFELFDFPDGRL